MLNRLNALGISPAILDTVTSIASVEMANKANVGGIDDQVKLLETAGYDEDKIVQAALKLVLEVDMTILVDEPKLNSASHNNGFEGFLENIHDDHLSVRDGDDIIWDISYKDILQFSK